jgi:uncharacterized membrane protein
MEGPVSTPATARAMLFKEAIGITMAEPNTNPRWPQAEPRAATPQAAPQPALNVRVEHVEVKPTAPAPGGAQPAAASPSAQQSLAGQQPPKGEAHHEATAPSRPFSERVPEHVAAMLAYLFGWVSGLILLFVDRRPFVRYHAAQSVVVFAVLSGVLLLLGDFFLATLIPHAAGVWMALRRIVELIWLAAAIVLMLKASSGERYRVPRAAKYADRAAHDPGAHDHSARHLIG